MKKLLRLSISQKRLTAVAQKRVTEFYFTKQNSNTKREGKEGENVLTQEKIRQFNYLETKQHVKRIIHAYNLALVRFDMNSQPIITPSYFIQFNACNKGDERQKELNIINQVIQAINGLNEIHRIIFISMFFFNEYHNEIAEKLFIATTTLSIRKVEMMREFAKVFEVDCYY